MMEELYNPRLEEAQQMDRTVSYGISVQKPKPERYQFSDLEPNHPLARPACLRWYFGLLVFAGSLIGISSLAISEPTATNQIHKYRASPVSLQNTLGHVIVKVHDKRTIEIRITGGAKIGEAVSIIQSKGWLTIRGIIPKNHFTSGSAIVVENNIVVVGPGASSTVIIGNQVLSSEAAANPNWELVLMVPKHQQLEILGIVGQIDVGDLEGLVNVDVKGAGAINLGASGTSKIKLVGSTSVSIASVSGDLHIEVAGASDVQIRDGEIGNLFVRIQGAGDISIEGQAQYGDLGIVGSGDINVAKIINKPKLSIVGAGDISYAR